MNKTEESVHPVTFTVTYLDGVEHYNIHTMHHHGYYGNKIIILLKSIMVKPYDKFICMHIIKLEAEMMI